MMCEGYLKGPALPSALALRPCLPLQLYQLLSDRFPFWDVELHQIDSLGGSAIREGIMHGPVLFPLQPWCTTVHSSAQDLIVRMLDRNPETRITAAEALEHPWLKMVLSSTDA
jgi:calcium-dependent protein kinase